MPLPQSVSKSAFFHALIAITLFGVCVPGAYAGHQQLVCNPRSLWFGKIVTGQSQTLPVTLTNNGPSTVTVTQVGVNSGAFTVGNFKPPVTLAAGQSANLTVTFAPATIGNVSGIVTFTSNASNPTLNLPVGGKGVNDWALQANPTSLGFGNVAVGGSSTLPLTIINPGGTSQTVSIGKVGGTGFTVSGVTLPLILAPYQSFTFSVTFAPQSAGDAIGSILATSPSSPSLTVPLSGTGVAAGQLTVSPAAINFGGVTVGQSSSQGAKLTAGTSSVTVSTASMSNPAFTLSGISLPVTIPAGQSVSYTVTFAPQNSGAASGTLSFASNAFNAPTVQSLAGTGNSPQHSVSLSWDPSTSQDVAGYNVYRSGQSGGPYSKINSVLDPNTAYSDGSVAGGQTYYYATTAVSSGGQESNYSNLVQAVIP